MIDLKDLGGIEARILSVALMHLADSIVRAGDQAVARAVATDLDAMTAAYRPVEADYDPLVTIDPIAIAHALVRRLTARGMPPPPDELLDALMDDASDDTRVTARVVRRGGRAAVADA